MFHKTCVLKINESNMCVATAMLWKLLQVYLYCPASNRKPQCLAIGLPISTSPINPEMDACGDIPYTSAIKHFCRTNPKQGKFPVHKHRQHIFSWKKTDRN